MGGSGINWTICKSVALAPDRYDASTPPLSFYRLDALYAAQPTVSKHWWSYTDSVLENIRL